uniref:adenylate kinase n=1 Tax=Rhizophora mucronata TaxID=61149 RepID=A0A2P2P9P7_RHIMU
MPYGLVHIAAGDLLRAEIASGSENGRRAKEHMEKGQLVPGEIIVVVGMTQITLLQNCLFFISPSITLLLPCFHALDGEGSSLAARFSEMGVAFGWIPLDSPFNLPKTA